VTVAQEALPPTLSPTGAQEASPLDLNQVAQDASPPKNLKAA
jgi:hypothetical protein